jgi:hypothetical protein
MAQLTAAARRVVAVVAVWQSMQLPYAAQALCPQLAAVAQVRVAVVVVCVSCLVARVTVWACGVVSEDDEINHRISRECG